MASFPKVPRSACGRRSLLIGCAAVAVGAARVARADEDWLARIGAARSSLRTVQAKFEQERTLGLLATRVISKGELAIVRPDRLRWDLLAPDSVTYWVGPSGLAYASPRSQGSRDTSSAGPVGAVLQDLLTAIGGDLSRLTSRYSIEAAGGSEGTVRVTIRPREEASARVMRSLSMLLDRDLVSPKEMTLEESGDDRITVRFNAVRINQPVDAARMSPPRSR